VIKLYYSPGACSLAPHIVLEELGIAYDSQLVSIKDGDQRKPEFLRVNPRARVPALVVDGKVLTECVAILTYLGGGYASRGLWPKDTWKQAEVISLMSWLASIHSSVIAGVFRPERFTDDMPAREAVTAHAKAQLQKHFADVDKMLTGKNFAMGTQYTVCDPYLLVFYRWGNRMGFDMKSLYPNWTKHALRIAQRPTVRRVFEVEEIRLEG
jgi:glutathione S-transferase